MDFNPFVQTETYRRDLHAPIRKPGDPPDEVVGWVELRPLNAGDRAEFNEIKLQASGGQYSIGLIQLLMVERAVEAWSFETPPTLDTIRMLDPDIFDQIFEHVSLGNPTIAETVAEIREGPDADPTDADEPSRTGAGVGEES